MSNEANNFQMVFSQKPQKTHLNEKTFQTFVKSIDFAIVYEFCNLTYTTKTLTNSDYGPNLHLLQNRNSLKQLSKQKR